MYDAVTVLNIHYAIQQCRDYSSREMNKGLLIGQVLRVDQGSYNPNKSRVFNVWLDRFMGNKLHSFWLHPTSMEILLLGYEH